MNSWPREVRLRLRALLAAGTLGGRLRQRCPRLSDGRGNNAAKRAANKHAKSPRRCLADSSVQRARRHVHG